MEKTNTLVKEYKIYQVLNKNVFGSDAIMHPLKYTFNSFKEHNQAEEWIINEGIENKEYVILEVLIKK